MSERSTIIWQELRLLILAKTYPTPSKDSVETTCVAAVTEQGQLRRIFPVPFRLLPSSQQFRKWQWVRAEFRAPTSDHRPESRRINTDSLVVEDPVPVGKDWAARMTWVQPHIVPTFTDLETRRQATKETLGFLRPSRILGLDVTPLPRGKREWTEEERTKLTRDLEQGDLFTDPSEAGRYRRRLLEKVPYHFHYRYEIETQHGTESNRHLITDWEAGELYRNCVEDHGKDWEAPFRAKLEAWMIGRDMVLMMGTQHQYPDQWLIISLIYPPRPTEELLATPIKQTSLDL